MSRRYKFEYFRSLESEQFSFYRIPKALFKDNYFKELSSDAKVLYGLMLDRMSLSIRNKWVDNEEKVYIIFTLEQVMEAMNCGKDKGVKIMAELDSEKGIGLIERKKQGLGKPAIIYVKSFIRKEMEPGEIQDSNIAEVKTSEKPKSGVLKNRSQDFGKSDSNNTNNNYTKKSDINLINQPMEERDDMEVYLEYKKIVKENIEYDILAHDYSHRGCEYIDEIVEIMLDVICNRRNVITISGTAYSQEIIKSKLLKITSSHMRYVLGCLETNTSKIKNIKAYILTCLYNAPLTMNNYYRAEVNHEMHH